MTGTSASGRVYAESLFDETAELDPVKDFAQHNIRTSRMTPDGREITLAGYIADLYRGTKETVVEYLSALKRGLFQC